MQDRATLIEPAPATMHDGLPDDRRRWAMAALCATVAISSLSTAIANIALPAIAAFFGVDPVVAGWAELAAGAIAAAALAGLAFAGALVVGGRLRGLLIGPFAVVLAGSAMAAVLFQRTKLMSRLATSAAAFAERHAPSRLRSRLRRLEEQVAAIVPTWSLAPLVQAYQAMRGASFLVAVTFAAEIGDVRRFETPRQLMSFLGLVPGERSTGETVRRQGLTLAGNRRAPSVD